MLRCSLNRTSTQALIWTGDCLLKSKRDTWVILTSFSFVSKTCRSCCAASGETEEDWAASCCRSLEALLVAGASSSISAQQDGQATVDRLASATTRLQDLACLKLSLARSYLGRIQGKVHFRHNNHNVLQLFVHPRSTPSWNKSPFAYGCCKFCCPESASCPRHCSYHSL